MMTFKILMRCLIFFSFFLAASAADKTKKNPPAIQAQRPQQWWYERHQEKLLEVKNNDAELVLIGDSITHYWERSPSYSYFFGDRKTLNLGYGGDQTQNVLWRLRNGELEGLKPKVISLLIGTNNSNNCTPAATLLGIKKILTELRLRLPKTKILLSSILPRGV